MQYTTVSSEEFAALGLDDWRFFLGAIHGTFRALTYSGGAELVAAIAAASDRADHHPDIDLAYPGRVHVVFTTHATGGLTTLDVDLAREVSQLAAEAGATAEPLHAQALEIAIDTMDADRIRDFWAAALDYRVAKNGSLFDPRRRGPVVWFQQMDEPRPDRSRIHIDIDVPHDIAEARIATAIEAGGRLINDQYARAFWVLADADGNEACICTWQDREG
jgi:4a-hydroxytetrahydrobiopterin dehydratase